MRVLALETSSAVGSLCVLVGGQVAAMRTHATRETRSGGMMRLVDAVLVEAGLRLDEVELFAAGLGPGSFTGVRVALSTVKGFHLATGAALVGVGSLDAVAAANVSEPRLGVVLDASRGEVFFAAFTHDEAGERRVVLDAACAPIERAGEVLQNAFGGDSFVVVGDARAEQWASLKSAAPGASVGGGDRGVPSARFVAMEAAAGRGTRDDGTLEPRYVRPVDAKLPAARGAVTPA